MGYRVEQFVYKSVLGEYLRALAAADRGLADIGWVTVVASGSCGSRRVLAARTAMR